MSEDSSSSCYYNDKMWNDEKKLRFASPVPKKLKKNKKRTRIHTQITE